MFPVLRNPPYTGEFYTPYAVFCWLVPRCYGLLAAERLVCVPEAENRIFGGVGEVMRAIPSLRSDQFIRYTDVSEALYAGC